MEALAKQKEMERIQQVYARRAGIAEPSVQKAQPKQSHEETLAQQITAEIDERREYLESMNGMGLDPSEEAKIKGEITQRIAELRRLQLS